MIWNVFGLYTMQNMTCSFCHGLLSAELSPDCPYFNDKSRKFPRSINNSKYDLTICNWIFAIALCKWSCSHLSTDCNMCIVFLIQGRELFPSKFSVCWHNIAFYQPVYCSPKKLQNREGASNENQDTLTDLTGFCAVFVLNVLSLALN